MAPEYLIQGVISIKADIFSLGVIIIEIVTGHRDYPLSVVPYLQQFNENDCPKSRYASVQHFKEKVRCSNEVFACVNQTTYFPSIGM
jgi:serine/threonine protein kinase